MKASRISSLVIGVVYILFALSSGDLEFILYALIYVVLFVGLIWFGDLFGQLTVLRIGRPSINKTTPGSIVSFGAWIILLIPIIITLVTLL